MTILKICLTLCLILFGSTFAHGEAVEVQCSLSPESGFIGDLFTYEVVLPRGKGYTLEAPEFPPDLEQVEVTLTEEGETLRYTYVLRSFTPGQYFIEPPRVVTPEGEIVDTVGTPVVVKVESLLTEDIQDIQGLKPLGKQGFARSRFMMISLGLLTILLGLGGFLWLRRPAATVTEPVPVPAHVLAYRILDELGSLELIRQGRIQEYYVRLSNCLRSYVEKRFNVRALEMTTEEFLASLQGVTFLERNQKRTVDAFLRHCDLVKFAGYRPDEAEALRAYELCKAFVDETRDETSVV
ncbi:MAG TPA: hypothetical protein GXX57_05620 [Firmicutes bacterium]|nr:hypothetical protein [Bacillota bacterium]